MLYGQARFNDGLQLVVFTQCSQTQGSTVYVRRTYKTRPIGPQIKRHIRKHGVKVHGENVIRRDWMKD